MGEMVRFDEVRQMAAAIARSGLFGVRDENQALALMLLAQSEGLHPMRAVQEYHIINGRPAMRADAMLARFINAGGRVEWHRLDNEAADATFSHPAGGTARISWSLADAKRAGLIGKTGGNWEKFPRAMLRSRVVSEGVRTVYPAVVVGVYTPEEVIEFEPVTTAERTEGVQPVEAEVENALPAPTPITGQQIKKIAALLGELGMADKDGSRSFCSQLLGRKLNSVKELTEAEASRLIEMLSNEALMEEKVAEWLERESVEASEASDEHYDN